RSSDLRTAPLHVAPSSQLLSTARRSIVPPSYGAYAIQRTALASHEIDGVRTPGPIAPGGAYAGTWIGAPKVSPLSLLTETKSFSSFVPLLVTHATATRLPGPNAPIALECERSPSSG